MLFMMSILVIQTNLSEHVRDYIQGGTESSGRYLAFNALAQFTAGCVYAALIRKPKRWLLPIVLLLGAGGYALMGYMPFDGAAIGLGSILCGLSQSVVIPALIMLGSNTANNKSSISVLTALMSFGGLISPIVMNQLSMSLTGGVNTVGAFWGKRNCTGAARITINGI